MVRAPAIPLLEAPAGLRRWLAARRAGTPVRCEAVPFAGLRRWSWTDGRLVHDSGRFFSVAGVRPAGGRDASRLEAQAILLQPEVGLLGFLRREGPDLLVQAKAEPGTVHGVQIGPSVQATESNYERVHGGAPTPYLATCLRPEAARLRADSLQSEQGTRFLAKRNRNLLVDAAGEEPPPGRREWAWARVAALLPLLGEDHAVNTDARSVLVSSPWADLAPGGTPFAGPGTRRAALRASHERVVGLRAARARLARARRRADVQVETVPLDRLPGWTCTTERVARRDGGSFEVRGYRVGIPGREVEAWDQPLVRGLRPGRCVLGLQRRGGLLQVRLSESLEIGFARRVQLGPTLQEPAPAGPTPAWARRFDGPESRPWLACTQSDEGGRFRHALVRYAVRELHPRVRDAAPEDGCWVSLGALERLAREPGVLTNEARSCVSLLLSLL